MPEPVLGAVQQTPAPKAPETSPILERVVKDFTRSMADAQAAKGGEPLDAASAQDQARRLIDVPDGKRILWVDDHPENNAGEAAALAKLQIEVETVRSTEEALARLDAAENGGFDLVISDWSRNAEGAMAGLRLATSMRRHGHSQPLVFYHGTFGAVKRTALATAARAAGAFGEAVLPAELMRLVLTALHA